MATLTVYGSTSDALLQSRTDVSYAAAREAASATYLRSTSHNIAGQRFSVGDYTVWRSGYYFDTSSLPTGAVISAAVITLTKQGFDGLQTFNVVLVNGDDLDDPMVASNFGDLLNDTTALANVVDAFGWAYDGSEEFTLTGAGRAKITTSGTTKFGVRSSRDINGDTPADGQYENIQIYSAEESTTAYKPKLVITYTYPNVYPTDAITRVTNLIHRYHRAKEIYTLELNLGEVVSDFGLPNWVSKPQSAVPDKEIEEVVAAATGKSREEVEDMLRRAERFVSPTPTPPVTEPEVIFPKPPKLPPVSDAVTEERPFLPMSQEAEKAWGEMLGLPHVCRICGARFETATGLQVHIRQAHGGL